MRHQTTRTVAPRERPGEIGTVTAHNGNGTFQMTLDDVQPFHRWVFGAKSKPTDNGGMVHKVLSPSEVESLPAAYRGNAARFRRIAKSWDEDAKRELAREKEQS